MFYDRKIKYLDCYERGERIKGCGFVKIEARDDELRFEITVSGLHPTDSFSREVMLCSEKQEKPLAQLALSQGRGELKRIYHNRSNIGGTGIPYWELCGICIHLNGEREISCRWQKSENKSAERLSVGLQGPAAAEERETPWRQDKAERPPVERKKGEPSGETKAVHSGREAGPSESPQNTERVSLHAAAAKQEDKASQEVRDGKDAAAREEKTVEQGRQSPRRTERAAKPTEREEGQQTRLLEDKWQQLCAIYPHIQPFRDERDYLSIRPADFLLFPANAYKQVNNSFLLHGYYNYKHLLLSRMERRGEILYYIGVPGNFYEREKQVALMFGFESFECAEEPAQTGDFGYYMMRTEL